MNLYKSKAKDIENYPMFLPVIYPVLIKEWMLIKENIMVHKDKPTNIKYSKYYCFPVIKT